MYVSFVIIVLMGQKLDFCLMWVMSSIYFYNTVSREQGCRTSPTGHGIAYRPKATLTALATSPPLSDLSGTKQVV
ncbi:hypothetical protein GCM10025791_06360 [Halioxenophilus aromaticivorans]|uniref:Uncharacterized protein n=1 Tax=Halioxenophilus aromaticivorans TaxID=1306992 RepID=A0AAV3TXS4_9ALTE